jgi:hypothetical protein
MPEQQAAAYVVADGSVQEVVRLVELNDVGVLSCKIARDVTGRLGRFQVHAQALRGSVELL